jgi:hypothetical protein
MVMTTGGTYGAFVMEREDVVDKALDDGGLACADVADHQDLVQVLLLDAVVCFCFASGSGGGHCRVVDCFFPLDFSRVYGCGRERAGRCVCVRGRLSHFFSFFLFLFFFSLATKSQPTSQPTIHTLTEQGAAPGTPYEKKKQKKTNNKFFLKKKKRERVCVGTRRARFS